LGYNFDEQFTAVNLSLEHGEGCNLWASCTFDARRTHFPKTRDFSSACGRQGENFCVAVGRGKAEAAFGSVARRDRLAARARGAQSDQLDRVEQVPGHLAHDIDRELELMAATLIVLAGAPQLATGDFRS
jgi:hypothetical protein